MRSAESKWAKAARIQVRTRMEQESLMKRHYALATALLLSLMIAAGAKSGAPQSEDASKVVALENLWNQTQLNHDAAAMEKMLDEDFVLTDYERDIVKQEPVSRFDQRYVDQVDAGNVRGDETAPAREYGGGDGSYTRKKDAERKTVRAQRTGSRIRG